jgi:hypothetical protein
MNALFSDPAGGLLAGLCAVCGYTHQLQGDVPAVMVTALSALVLQ